MSENTTVENKDFASSNTIDDSAKKGDEIEVGKTVTNEEMSPSKTDTDEPEAKRVKETTIPTFFPSMEVVNMKRNEEGNGYYVISPMRRLTVKKWQDRILIDVREVRLFARLMMGNVTKGFFRDEYQDTIGSIVHHHNLHLSFATIYQ